MKPQEEHEADMLQITDEVSENSRLACQVEFTDMFNGLVVELAPE